MSPSTPRACTSLTPPTLDLGDGRCASCHIVHPPQLLISRPVKRVNSLEAAQASAISNFTLPAIAVFTGGTGAAEQLKLESGAFVQGLR